MQIDIFIRPRTKDARRLIYRGLTDEGKEKLKEAIFNREEAKPITRRGRPPKYDFLFVHISGISTTQALLIRDFLEGEFKRPVFMYSPEGENKYRYITSWTWEGETIPNSIPYFRELKNTIREIIKSGKIGERERILIKFKKKKQKDEEKSREFEESSQEEKREFFPNMGKSGIVEKKRKELEEKKRKEEEEKERRRKEREDIERMIKILEELEDLKKERDVFLKKANSIFALKSEKLKAQKKVNKIQEKIDFLKWEMKRIPNWERIKKIAEKEKIDRQVREVLRRGEI